MGQILANPFLLFLLLIWSLFWKGNALWRAAKDGQKYWFMALLVVNTVGILEIIYLRWFAKKSFFGKKSSRANQCDQKVSGPDRFCQ